MNTTRIPIIGPIIAERRAARAAWLAQLECLMAENRVRLAEIDAARECKWCAAMEAPSAPHPCREEFRR